MKLTFVLGSLLLLAACGDEALETNPPPPPGQGGGGQAPTPRIAFVARDTEAEVSELRYGEAFSVHVEGLAAGSEATLRSSFWGYRGWATFTAAGDGTIDTTRDAPSDGSYAGVHAEGLLWSMELESMEQGTDYHIDFVLEAADAQPIATASLARPGLNEGMTEEAVSDSGLVGVFFKAEGATGQLPAIMFMGGSEGGIDSARFRAAWFAGYGYATFGLAYFGVEGLPPEIEEIPLEYFDTALEYLAARPDVDPERIGVMGGSRGGELVLQLGAEFPRVRAVVAEVPSGVRWGGTGLVDASGWSLGGMPLPYLGNKTNAQLEPEMLPDGSIAYRLTPVFEAELAAATPEELDAATIVVEQTNGPVLMLSGADDGIWPSCTMSEIAFDRLVSSGHSGMWDDATHCFPDTGHSVAAPGWPTTGRYAGQVGAYKMVFGGTPEGMAISQREGLDLIKAFFEARLQR